MGTMNKTHRVIEASSGLVDCPRNTNHRFSLIQNLLIMYMGLVDFLSKGETRVYKNFKTLLAGLRAERGDTLTDMPETMVWSTAR